MTTAAAVEAVRNGLVVGLPTDTVYGVGADVTLPLATKKKLIAFLNLRYFWEFGARTTLEGNTFTFTATFPIPSIPLQ